MSPRELLTGLVRHWAWTLAAVAGLLAGGWAFYPRPLPVDVGLVREGRFEQTIREDGRLRVRQRYLIAAPTAADLLRSDLKVGDRVARDQVIARFRPVQPQLLDTRARQVLAARVGSAEAAWLAALATQDRQRATLAQARLDAERADRLAAERFISPAMRDQAALTLQAQSMALKAAAEQVHAAEHALDEARAALAQAAGTERGRAAPGEAGSWVLRAPVAGRILKIHQESGGPIAGGQPVVELADTESLEAVVDVLSGDALRVQPGAPVRLSLGQGIPPLAGRVSRIEPVAFTKVSALGIEEQRVNLIIAVDPAGAAPVQPGDGFRVDATVTLRVVDSALTVPGAALMRIGTRWAMMVHEQGRVHQTEVQVLERGVERVWIGPGPAPGTQVVLYPGGQLQDGQRVSVRVVAAEGS